MFHSRWAIYGSSKYKKVQTPGINSIPITGYNANGQVHASLAIGHDEFTTMVTKFLIEWKTASLALILKGRKPPDKMKSDRPPCLFRNLEQSDQNDK